MRILIAHARQDKREATSALLDFIDVMKRKSAEEELFGGNAGHLAAAATLHDAVSAQNMIEYSEFESVLENELNRFNQWIAGSNHIGREPRLKHLGMAHGWAGILYAVLVAAKQLGLKPTSAVKNKLKELASFAEPIGRGLGWTGSIVSPGEPTTPAYAPGWCSGSAGFVMLWLAAFNRLQDEHYKDLALGAGWHVWEHPDDSPNLCCGLAGRALALLNLYKALGDEQWLDRAIRLIESADCKKIHEPGARNSLFRGDLGVILLAMELERPSMSVMPLFEAEGWSFNTT